MKRRLACFFLACLLLPAFAACNQAETPARDDTLQIVSTIFPPYDWLREILGDDAARAELTLLLSSGVDLHSYQPSADDIIKISTCDMLIYVGGASDSWVADAHKIATNENMILISLLDVLGDAVKEEQFKEGMEHEHEDEHEDEDDHEHGAYCELDEHVWLSLRCAQTLCAHLAAQLSALDATHAAVYQENAAAYIERLSAMDSKYRDALADAAFDTLLFAEIGRAHV